MILPGVCRHLVKAGLLLVSSADAWSLGIPTLHTFTKTFNIGRKALLTVITKCKCCKITQQVRKHSRLSIDDILDFKKWFSACSPLGRHLLFCMNWYKCSLCDIFRPNISRIDGFIVTRVFNYSTVSSLQQANFLRECVMVRDGLSTLPNWFSVSDIDVIIDCLCCD